MVQIKEIFAIIVLLILAWSTIFFGLSPAYTFVLIAVIYAVWVLTPPYPDMELLVVPVLIGLFSYVLLKSRVGKKTSKKKVVILSTALSFVLVYTTALLILYLAITLAGFTELFGFNIDFFGWANV